MNAVRARLGQLQRPDAVTLVVLGIAVVALALRLYDLGARALHHDESLHATYSWYFSSNRFDPPYRHDPLMHGPFQFHFMALFFKLFGDGDFMARLPAVLTSTALIATPLLLRRWLGTIGTVAAAAFLAFSPSLFYYSRFAREDIYMWLWTALIFIAVWRYLHDGFTRWLVVIAAALALSFATKESVYLTVAVVLLYLNTMLTLELLDRRGTQGGERWLEGVFLFPFAWLMAAFWEPLTSWRESRGFNAALPRAGDLIIVIGVLSLPQLAAGIQIPLTALGMDVSGDTERQVGIITVSSLLGIATIVGLLWDWRRWLLVAGIFYVITIPLFTTEFLNTRNGLSSDFWGALDYWLAQHDVRRGEQPWFYYFMMLPLYEFLTLIPAFIGGIWLLRRRDGFAAMLVWWFIGTFIVLSYAGEKMPWLVTHLALPLAFLAAYILQHAIPLAIERLRDRRAPAGAWAGAGVLAVAGLLVVLFSLRTAQGVAYSHPDTPLEPLIYVQTSRDVPDISKQIHELAEEWPDRSLPILVDSSEGMAWPWAWYLRDLPNVGYTSPDAIAAGVDPGTVVLALPTTLARNPELREQAAETREYHHRWWFPEEGYRGTTWSNFTNRLLNGRLLESWAEFARNRIPEESLGSLNAEALIPPPPPAASN